MPSNNVKAVLLATGQREDGPFQPPHPSCQELAEQYYASDLDLDRFLANAYGYFASDKTKRLFGALHHALGVLSIEGHVTAAERISSLSPHSVDPHRRHVWTPVYVSRSYRLKEGSSYEGPLEKAPLSEIEYEKPTYTLPVERESTRACPTTGEPQEVSAVREIPCIKKTVSEKNDRLQKGSDYSYDPVSGEIAFSNQYSETQEVVVGYEQRQATDPDGNPLYEEKPVYEMVPDRTEDGYWRRDESGERAYRKGSVERWEQGDPIMEDDPNRPVIVERPVFDVPDGTYWIPAVKTENPYLWDVTAKGVGVERDMMPSKYTPKHWPYLLQLFEFGLQRGMEERAVECAVSGLAGNPFAYADGRIVGKERGKDRDYVVIDPEDPDDAPDGQGVLYCEVPHGKGVRLLNIGTEVEKFDPLLRSSPVTVTFNNEKRDALWSQPLRIERLDANSFKILPIYTQRADGSVEVAREGFQRFFDIAFGIEDSAALSDWEDITQARWGEESEWEDADWLWADVNRIVTRLTQRKLRIRNVTQGYETSGTIRRIRRVEDDPTEEYGIVIDEYLPDFGDRDVIVLQVLQHAASDASDIVIDVQNLPYNGVESLIQAYAEESMPRGALIEIRLQKYWWGQMLYDWSEYVPTWSGEDCPEPVLTWDDPYDPSQRDAWDWAVDNWEEANDEIWSWGEGRWGEPQPAK
jgi:hypothetical protein